MCVCFEGGLVQLAYDRKAALRGRREMVAVAGEGWDARSWEEHSKLRRALAWRI